MFGCWLCSCWCIIWDVSLFCFYIKQNFQHGRPISINIRMKWLMLILICITFTRLKSARTEYKARTEFKLSLPWKTYHCFWYKNMRNIVHYLFHLLSLAWSSKWEFFFKHVTQFKEMLCFPWGCFTPLPNTGFLASKLLRSIVEIYCQTLWFHFCCS